MNCPICLGYDKAIPMRDGVCAFHGKVNDAIKPSYYDNDACIRAIEEATKDLKGAEAFITGNVIKYMWRWKRKNGVEDLKKVQRYLDMLIEMQSKP